MPALTIKSATEKLAHETEHASSSLLREIYAEIYPSKVVPPKLDASSLAKQIRSGLRGEEVVDLWNVIIPADRHVWYNEISNEIHYNEELVGAVD